MEKDPGVGVVAAFGLRHGGLGLLVTLEALFAVLRVVDRTWRRLCRCLGLVKYNILGPVFATDQLPHSSAGLSDEVYGAVRAVYARYSGWSSRAPWLEALLPGRRAAALGRPKRCAASDEVLTPWERG